MKLGMPMAALLLLVLSGCGLAGCASLPSAGPSARALQASRSVSVVLVTPHVAKGRAKAFRAARRRRLHQALAALSRPAPMPRFAFRPGDTLHVRLFTISPWTMASAAGGGVAPFSVDLGSYLVGSDGKIVLPYAGPVEIAGLDLAQAQERIGARYSTLHLLQSPAIKLTVGRVPQASILVTGAIGMPRTVPWTPAGISLATALTEALGNGADLLAPALAGADDHAAVLVSVYHAGKPPVRLPMQAALVSRVALVPGDRIVVRKTPTVRINVLGGGVARDGEYRFSAPPSLATVLARASGLHGNTADDHAVFVLEHRAAPDRPVLYDFAWNKTAGLVASQDFPLRDGDIVYVAEAPIVPVQRAIDILFQLLLPVQVLK